MNMKSTITRLGAIVLFASWCTSVQAAGGAVVGGVQAAGGAVVEGTQAAGRAVARVPEAAAATAVAAGEAAVDYSGGAVSLSADGTVVAI